MALEFLTLRKLQLAHPLSSGSPTALRYAALAFVVLVSGVAALLPVIVAQANTTSPHTSAFVLHVLVLAGVALVPLLLYTDALDGRQFAQYPLTAGRIFRSLLVSTVVTWWGLLLIAYTAVLFLITPIESQLWWAAVVGAVLTVCTALTLYRLSAQLIRLWVPPQFRHLVRLAGVIVLASLLPIALIVFAQSVVRPDDELLLGMLRVFAYTPFGASFAGVISASQLDVTAIIIHFSVSIGWLVTLATLFFFSVRTAMTTISRTSVVRSEGDTAHLIDALPSSPISVIASRALTYWRRDARYRIGLIAVPVAPIVMFGALYVVGVELSMLVLLPVPIVLLLLGWSVHNDIAHDSTAIWMHVASATKGMHDRLGRLAPVAIVAIPVLFIGTGLSVAISGRWQLMPVVFAFNAAVLMISAGVSSVFSASFPYPTTRPGDTPFSSPSLFGSNAGLLQTTSMIVVLGLIAPSAVAAWFAIVTPHPLIIFIVTVLSLGYGAAVFWAAIRLGAREFERKGPELVALMQSFD